MLYARVYTNMTLCCIVAQIITFLHQHHKTISTLNIHGGTASVQPGAMINI